VVQNPEGIEGEPQGLSEENILFKTFSLGF
jgi:hypothetical protein